jgi:hypothetical protein
MINCNVCNKPLLQSGNSTLYYCPIETRWIEKLNRNISYHHIFVGTNKNNEILRKLITVPPYIIDIDYEANITKVKKIISFKIKTLKEVAVKLDADHEEKDIFEVNAIINLPWNNIDELEEKINIYNLFS